MASKYPFDIIRVVALTGVVVDHFFQMAGSEYLDNTGLCWGGVSVAVFFTLSSYLYGEKWRNSEKQGFDILSFLKKRFLRIYIPLWVSLLFIIALEWYAQHPLDIETIVFNFLGLSWARPLTWAGHLWYITMIVILYLAYLALSRMRLDRLSLWFWGDFVCLAFRNNGMHAKSF